MKVKKIVLALASLSFVTPVLAATNIAVSKADQMFYISGATAQTPGLEKVLSEICATASGGSTFTTYTDGTATPVAKAFVCTATDGATFTNGGTGTAQLLGSWAVFKSEGGSGEAWKSIRQGLASKQLNHTNCDTTAKTCSVDTSASKVATLGFSDVQPMIFAAKAQLASLAAGRTTSDYAVSTTNAGQGFGVVVSNDLYTALQTNQNTTNAPTVTSGQMAKILTNAGGAAGAGMDVLFSGTAGKPTASSSNRLYIARRSTSSGTQLSAEIFFLNTPCAGKAGVGGELTSQLGSSTGTNLGAAYYVKQEASSNDVLEMAKSNTISKYVIGVVSLENAQPAGNSWKYVAIDNVHPGTDTYQKANVLNGTYPFAFDTYIARSINSNGISTAPSAVLPTLANEIINRLGNGANLATAYGMYSSGDSTNTVFNSGSTNTLMTGNTSHYSRGGNECSPLKKVW